MILNMVTSENKRKRLLDVNREELVKGIAPGQVLERQLQDGDIVLFNRQPSLHRMSIMAHKVKVLPGKTFRLNLCTTPPYGADFDGDEMNLHVPQTLEAQAEAKYLLAVQEQIFSPRDGRAVIAGEQDSIMGLYFLTKEDTYLTKEEVQYLLGYADIREMPPEDKKGLYRGRDVFSMLLPKKLNFEDKKGNNVVKIKNGKLVEGVITKSAYGEGNRLYVTIAMEYGMEELKNFISYSARLSDAYTTISGITVGIKEYVIQNEALEGEGESPAGDQDPHGHADQAVQEQEARAASRIHEEAVA